MVTIFDLRNDEGAARQRMIAYLRQKGVRPDPTRWNSYWEEKTTAEIRQAYLQAFQPMTPSGPGAVNQAPAKPLNFHSCATPGR